MTQTIIKVTNKDIARLSYNTYIIYYGLYRIHNIEPIGVHLDIFTLKRQEVKSGTERCFSHDELLSAQTAHPPPAHMPSHGRLHSRGAGFRG